MRDCCRCLAIRHCRRMCVEDRKHGPSRRRDRAPPRRARRGCLPTLSRPRAPRWPLLAGRRRPQHTGVQPVCKAGRFPNGHGRVGKWTDAATGEHGDLLDIIATAEGHDRLSETLDETRRFLSLPITEPERDTRKPYATGKAESGSAEAAARLFAASKPIAGTIAEAYLRRRGLSDLRHHTALRYHSRCYYRPSDDDAPGTRMEWPALIAAITDERPAHWRSSNLARSLDARQGADRRSTPFDGRSAWGWRPLRESGSGNGRR